MPLHQSRTGIAVIGQASGLEPLAGISECRVPEFCVPDQGTEKAALSVAIDEAAAFWKGRRKQRAPIMVDAEFLCDERHADRGRGEPVEVVDSLDQSSDYVETRPYRKLERLLDKPAVDFPGLLLQCAE